jgi:hypothetical protein
VAHRRSKRKRGANAAAPIRDPRSHAQVADAGPVVAAAPVPDVRGAAGAVATEPPAVDGNELLEATLPGQVLVGLAIVFVLTFLGVALVRIRYPYALEWIEGGMLDEVRWILGGKKPYVAPSLDFVPFIYNPLYFWISAAVARVVGVGFVALRLVSLLASVGTLALLALLVRKETGSAAAAAVAAGLYASTFRVTQQFMDLARVDSLFVFFAVLALYLLRTRPTAAGLAGAAASLVASFLTKQSGAIVAAPLVAWVLFERVWEAKDRRSRLEGVVFAAVTVVGIGGSAWLLEWWTDGWYRYYAFDVPRQHRLVPWLWADFWTVDVMGPFACACVGAVFVLFGPGGLDRPARRLWGAALVGVLLASWSARLHDGGWTNVLMPTFAVLAALLAISLHRGFTLAARVEDRELRVGVQTFVLLVGILQLAMNLYDPRRVVPKERDREAGDRVVAILRSAPGDVFVPTDSYLAPMAGKRPHLHQMAVDDLLRAPNPTSAELQNRMRTALSERRWSTVITDNDFFAEDVLANYDRSVLSVTDPDSFYPVTGVHYRPGWVFQPKPQPPK